MTQPRRILIIGGGISGLSSAFRIQQACPDAHITVAEAAPHFGGAIRSERREEPGFNGSWLLEAGPDSMIRTKPAGPRLLDDLGLADIAIPTLPTARRSFIAKGNNLHPVPEGLYLLAPGKLLPFALSPIVSWPGKLRMGLDLLIPRRGAHKPEESLAGFVRRRLGNEALARIAQPMVGGIYTADPEHLSLRHTFPLFEEMEAKHRSLLVGMRARMKAQAANNEQASGPRYGLFLSLP